MFEKIKTQSPNRSDLIRKHEADYTALLEEKVKVEAARDESVGRVNDSYRSDHCQRDKASPVGCSTWLNLPKRSAVFDAQKSQPRPR